MGSRWCYRNQLLLVQELQGEDEQEQVRGKSGKCLCLPTDFQRWSNHCCSLSVVLSRTYSCPQNRKTFTVGSFGSLMTDRDLCFVLGQERDLQTWLGRKSQHQFSQVLMNWKPKAGSLRSCESPGPSAGLLGHLHLEWRWHPLKASHCAVFFHLGMSWSSLCSCPAGSSDQILLGRL